MPINAPTVLQNNELIDKNDTPKKVGRKLPTVEPIKRKSQTNALVDIIYLNMLVDNCAKSLLYSQYVHGDKKIKCVSSKNYG